MESWLGVFVIGSVSIVALLTQSMISIDKDLKSRLARTRK